MKRATILAVILTLMGTALVAHGTDSHTVFGTVKSIEADHVTITTAEGKDVAIALTDQTLYIRGGESASRSDLQPGIRVVIKLTHDNKAAVSVKMPAKK